MFSSDRNNNYSFKKINNIKFWDKTPQLIWTFHNIYSGWSSNHINIIYSLYKVNL